MDVPAEVTQNCMAINVSVQHNGGFLPDIILLTQCYYHHRGSRLTAPLFPIGIESLMYMFFFVTVRQMGIKGI